MNKKRKPIFLTIAIFAVILAGCAVFALKFPAKYRFVMKPPSGMKDLLTASAAKASPDNSAFYDSDNLNSAMKFQLDMLKTTAEKDKNTFISPLSAGIALTMAANGADGATLEAFEKALGTNLNGLNNFYGAAQERLNNSANPTVLNVANAIFVDDSRLKISENFVEDCGNYFAAGLYSLDFSAPSSVKSINNWAKDNTKGKIDEIIDSIDVDQIMFLTNAVYFEGKWLNGFDKNKNYIGDFAAPPGEVKTEYMRKELECRYYNDDKIALAILPYKGGEYSFMALMPSENFNGWLQNLTVKDYFELFEKTRKGEYTIGLPKFEAEFSYDLNEPLKKMGLTPAFDEDNANFTKIGEASGNIYISAVSQKTYLKVDEEGTVAAVVTIMSLNDEGVEPSEIIFDKPFLYAIIENKTNLPLFIGIMNDPTAE